MPTSTLHHKAQTAQLLRKLVRLGGLGETAVKSDRPHLRLVSAAAPAPILDPVTTPARTVDSSGRLKLLEMFQLTARSPLVELSQKQHHLLDNC